MHPPRRSTSASALRATIVPALVRSAVPGRSYVGVGSEQNFTYIVAIRPVIAFVIDIRRGNLDLHLIYKVLFELSADRRAESDPCRRGLPEAEGNASVGVLHFKRGTVPSRGPHLGKLLCKRRDATDRREESLYPNPQGRFLRTTGSGRGERKLQPRTRPDVARCGQLRKVKSARSTLKASSDAGLREAGVSQSVTIPPCLSKC